LPISTTRRKRNPYEPRYALTTTIDLVDEIIKMTIGSDITTNTKTWPGLLTIKQRSRDEPSGSKAMGLYLEAACKPKF
jgi:hypothetical protein